MDCPKCSGTLEEKTFGGQLKVHRCNQCMGLWCNREMLPQMKKEWMSDAVFDAGDPNRGRELNELEEVKCPECGEEMTKTVDEKQQHIWLEVCEDCNGVWFDAGEFTDWKHETLMDVIRGMLKKERG